MKSDRKKVLVELIVEVDKSVPVSEVRRHIAREAQSSKGQYTGMEWYDWRSDIKVTIARLQYPKAKRK
jgi:hypothetical protein